MPSSPPVGDGMRHRPGVSGRIFGVLGNHGINVRAIAQGASERNVSVVVSGADGPRAVRAVHDAFFRAATTRGRTVRRRSGASGRGVPRSTGGSCPITIACDWPGSRLAERRC